MRPEKDISLTPLSLICSLGEFDLDPCGLKSHLTAKNIIELPEDGLKIEWNGKVWLNPPYSNPKPWLEKLALHHNGMALVLNSTDTIWFQELILRKATSIFFLRGRPKFTRKNGSVFGIMRGVVLAAYGSKCDKMLMDFTEPGFYINFDY